MAPIIPAAAILGMNSLCGLKFNEAEPAEKLKGHWWPSLIQSPCAKMECQYCLLVLVIVIPVTTRNLSLSVLRERVPYRRLAL